VSEVAPGIHRLGTEKVNWYLVEDGARATCVDAGLPTYADQLESTGRAPRDVEALVLTHADLDHVGLAPVLQGGGASVHVHGEDEERLRTGKPKKTERSLLPYMRHWTALSLIGHLLRNGGPKPATVDGASTYSDGQQLDVPGRPRVVHTPGHTPGHCALHFEEHGALFAGDLLCSRNPLTGREGPQVGPSGFNVDTRRALDSLARIERLEASIVLFGHGDPWRGTPAEAVARAREAGTS
jgi:glyoxylase-like metal-dependent hydrolase (beta-lactamase superfamily II)